MISTSGGRALLTYVLLRPNPAPDVCLYACQDLVSRLTADNPVTNNGVLQVAHSVFKRWRPLFRSDDLYTEINFVLGKFADPFLQLFQVRVIA